MANYDQIIVALKKIVHLKEEDFSLVAEKMSLLRLEKNEIWEHEGRICESMGFVNSGILRQYCLKDGAEFTTDFYLENEFVGNYVSYQTRQPSTTFTAAVEPCEMWVMSFKDFVSFYESIPVTKETAKKVGDQKLLRVHERNSSLLTDSPEERYYKLLEQNPN